MNSATVQLEKTEYMIRRMRRSAMFGLPTGALILGAFFAALEQGRSIPGPSLAIVVLGAGMLAVSIRILLPSYPRSVKRRLARLEGMTSEEQRTNLDRMLRKQFVVVAIVLLVETPIAILLWPLADWRSIIVGAVGTTVLLLALLSAVLLRRRRIPNGSVPP